MFATAPPSKVTRALAMSVLPVSTGTPTASTVSTGRPASPRTRSMSWIIRSSTTATSVPRGLKGARRCDSMKRGSSRYGSQARSAPLKRSTCPVATLTPRDAAASTIRFASSSVEAIGFSISRWTPASIAASETSAWRVVGTATTAASTCSSSSSRERKARTPSSAATVARRSGSSS